jgi:YD repeat-containing protein
MTFSIFARMNATRDLRANRPQAAMKKKTRSISIVRHNYILRYDQEDALDETGLPSHFTELDHEGRTLREISYSAAGDFEEMYEYTYNEKGELMREAYSPEEGLVAEEKTFIRNDDGRLLEVKKRYQDGSVDTIDYQYDEAGNLVRVTTTDDEGVVEETETFAWENGELAGHEIFDADGDPIPAPEPTELPSSTAQITRDDEDRVILEEELNDEGEVITSIARNYNADGLPESTEVFIDGQGRTVTRRYILKYSYTFFD